MTWRRSSFCEGGACVEVAFTDVVLVRDAAGVVVRTDRAGWRAFLADVKAGALDIPAA